MTSSLWSSASQQETPDRDLSDPTCVDQDLYSNASSPVNDNAIPVLRSLVRLLTQPSTQSATGASDRHGAMDGSSLLDPESVASRIAALCCEGLSASFVLLMQHNDLNLIQHAQPHVAEGQSDLWVKALRRQLVAKSQSQQAVDPYRTILACVPKEHEGAQLLVVSLSDPDSRSKSVRSGYMCFLREADKPAFSDRECELADLFGVETSRQLGRLRDRATGFHNEAAFSGLFAKALKSRDSSSKSASLLYINADSLLRIQGALGDDAFEEALAQFSLLIRKRLRQRDLAGRVRHAHFALYLPGCDTHNASTLAASFLDTLTSFRYERAGQIFSLSVTQSIVPVTNSDHDVDVLLSYGEASCETQCDAGHFVVCDTDNLPSLLHGDAISWASRIEQALKQESIQLYAQPVVFAHDLSQTDHHEILLRPSGLGDVLVSSLVFVNAAVRFGYIQQVDHYMVRHSFAFISELYEKKSGTQAVFSLNLSGQTLTQDFATLVLAAYENAAFPAHAVIFEIAEVDVMSSLTTVMPAMRQLKSAGFRFALDSFGQGIGSFLQLEKLDIDYVKIDGSLIRTMHRDPLTSELVKTVQTISAALGVHCVAKQVSNDEGMQAVLDARVPLVQGHHLQRPVRLKHDMF